MLNVVGLVVFILSLLSNYMLILFCYYVIVVSNLIHLHHGTFETFKTIAFTEPGCYVQFQ